MESEDQFPAMKEHSLKCNNTEDQIFEASTSYYQNIIFRRTGVGAQGFNRTTATVKMSKLELRIQLPKL